MAAERPSTAAPVRLLQLWALAARMDAIWVTRDIRSYLTYMISDGLCAIGSVTATLLIAGRFSGIGAWTKDHVLFLMAWALLVTGLRDTLFNFNVAYISRRIGRGQLDHCLLQPQPLWMTLLTEGFTPVSGVGALLPGMLLGGWSVARLNLQPEGGWWLLACLNLVSSVAVTLSIAWLWGSLAFWAPRAAEEISMSAHDLVSGLKPLPLDGAGPSTRGVLLSVFPVGFVAWYPSRALLGLQPEAWGPWVTPLAALLLLFLTALVFSIGLRQYARVGSQRYDDLGHRR